MRARGIGWIATLAVAVALVAVTAPAPAQALPVRVNLANGEVLHGTIEASDLAGADEPGARSSSGKRIRLARPQGAAGHLLLRPGAVAALTRIERLPPPMEPEAARSRAEIMEEWRQHRERQCRLRCERRREAEAAEHRDETASALAPPRSSDAIRQGDESRLRRLITRFHPSDGFTPGRRVVIEWRMTTLDVFPSEKERDWLEVYDAWLEAWDWWLGRAVPGIAPEDHSMAPPSPEILASPEYLAAANASRGGTSAACAEPCSRS